MDTGTAAIIGSLVTGSAVVSASLGGSWLQMRHQAKAARQQFLQERLAALLPKRQDALQETWSLVHRVGAGQPLSEHELMTYLPHTLWLPYKIRMTALQLILNPGDEVARADVAAQLVAYLDIYEFEPELQRMAAELFGL
jgi:hypothetical protein